MREPGLPALPFGQPGPHHFVLSRTFETAGSHAPAPLHPLRAFPDDAASEQRDAGLQALALVAESSSFTEVADKLHLTQSAVSRKIQQLESHYGAPLLVRNSRNMQLTEHGKAVLEVA
jgi:biotin operon repressor